MALQIKIKQIYWLLGNGSHRPDSCHVRGYGVVVPSHLHSVWYARSNFASFSSMPPERHVTQPLLIDDGNFFTEIPLVGKDIA